MPRDKSIQRPLLAAGTYAGKADTLRTWKNNAELIAEVMQMFHPRPHHGLVADVTYGRGTWWKTWGEPDVKHGLDLAGTGEFDDGVDFRKLPEPPGTFAVIAYDPPYVLQGGKDTTTVRAMKARYGLLDLPNTPEALQAEVIDAGLTSVHDTLEVGGIALVKVQNYVSGGDFWPGEYMTLKHAERLGFEMVSIYHHVRHPGPQPRRATKYPPPLQPRQEHPANNVSHLLVLRRRKPIEVDPQTEGNNQ